MVSQIQLGNFFSSGGRTVVGGAGGSGIDTQTLVKSLADAKRLPAVRLEDKIKSNGEKAKALGEFQTLMNKLKDAANFLRNPPGVGNAAENVFRYAETTVTSNTTIEGSTYVTVSASPGATSQSYSVTEISSLAQARKQRTGNISIATADSSAVEASPAAGQFKAGTFTLNGESITLAAGDSLNAVAAKFNAVSQDTGITANIIKVADGTYQLTFIANETGTNVDFDLNNEDVPGTLVDPDGIFATVTITNIQSASNAVFKLNGVSITRQSNNIDDVVDGLTFTLWQETPALTEITVTVSPDEKIMRDGVVNFVNAYNDLKIFTAKQLELDDNGQFLPTAVLASNQAFRSTVSNIGSQMASLVAGITAGDPSRLADIGITFSDLPESADNPLVRNILSVNEGKLNSEIASDPDGVRRLFEFDFVSDNPNLRIFSRTNALAVSSFTLTLNPTLGTYQATYNLGGGPVTVDLDSEAVSSGGVGVLLIGPEGTALEGMKMVYASTSTATIAVTTTQGLADRVFNISDIALTATTGSIAVELEALKTNDERLNAEIKRIDEQVERFRQLLLEKFGALEQAIARTNTLLQSLDANNQARNNG